MYVAQCLAHNKHLINICSQAWWLRPIIQVTGEVEMERITVQGQPGKKISKTLISTNKLGMVVYICTPSYTGISSAKSEALPEKLLNEKWLELCLKW
jgi:hypothetical protein